MKVRARKSNWIAGTAAAALIMSLAACGSSGGSTKAASPATTPAAPSASSSASGGTSKTITIGVFAPFSGSYQADGKENLQGVETAVQQINSQGGIKSLGGAHLKIVSVDAGTNGGSQASTAAAQLAADKPAFVISGPVSASVLPGAPVFERAQIPECTDGFADQLTTSGYHYLFELPPPGSVISKGAVPSFFQTLSLIEPGATKAAVVYDSNPAQQSLTVTFAKALKASGKINIVYESQFPLGSTNLAPIAEQIKASGAQILIPGATNPELESILGPLQASGVHIPIYNPGGGSPSGEDYLTSLGKYVNGQFAVVQFNHAANFSPAQNQLLAAANSAYAKQFHAAFMGEFGGEAYTCTWDLALAMDRAASTNGSKIRDAMVGYPYTSGPGSLEIPGKVEYNAQGVNVDGGSALAEWCNNDLVAVGPNENFQAKPPAECGA